MFEKLPSLRGFQPKFYSGGPSRFHVPLLYDLVAETKQKRVIALGFGDGQDFFTFCQAASEQKIDCECVVVRRDRPGESEHNDTAWLKGRSDAEEFYGEGARFFATPEEALAAIADASVDVLFVDDSDSGTEIRKDLAAWQAKLSVNAAVLLHGLRLERDDSPATAWNEWVGKRSHANLADGLGMGIALLGKSSPTSFFVKHHDDLAILHGVAAARIDAIARATAAEKAADAFETRQVWLDSLYTDRRKGGRWFQGSAGPKTRRRLRERIARELRRLPRNLGIARKKKAAHGPPEIESKVSSNRPADRYQGWIAEHEPDAVELEKQRELS